jgi:hypothetical protein
MGLYSRTLGRRLRTSATSEIKRHESTAAGIERLVCCGIERDGEQHGYTQGFKSHWELRAALGDEMPSESRWGDIEGFITSKNRFLTRREAVPLAIAAGQIHESWRGATRDLLSSDIKW